MSEFAAVEIGQEPAASPAHILDELRCHASSITGHIDGIASVLGEGFRGIQSDVNLRLAVRQLAHQRYTSAREDRQRLQAMLQQAEDRLSIESKVFAAVERLTRS
jgi:ABC-type uncharacterized transport system auxiliary subunit